MGTRPPKELPDGVIAQLKAEIGEPIARSWLHDQKGLSPPLAVYEVHLFTGKELIIGLTIGRIGDDGIFKITPSAREVLVRTMVVSRNAPDVVIVELRDDKYLREHVLGIIASLKPRIPMVMLCVTQRVIALMTVLLGVGARHLH